MKEGWEEKELKDLIEIKHGYAFKSDDFKTEFTGENPIVLTPGNFSEDSIIYFTEKNTKRCYGEFPEEFRFNIGDLVVVMTDLSSKMKILGKPAIINTENVLHNQRIGKVIFKNQALDQDFLFYFFQTDKYLQDIKNSATGTMVKHTAPKRITSNKIFYPKSIDEQKEIVAKLDEAFAAIDVAKANIGKNIGNARELFQSRLNEIFSRKGDGWEETTIGNLVNEGLIAKPLDGNHGEIHPKKGDFVSVGVPFIMACDLFDGKVNTEDCKYISNEQADGLRKGFSINNDVLLSHKGTIGRVAILETDLDYIVLTPQVTYYRILKNDKLFNQYIYYYFQSPDFQKEIKNIAGAGSTRAYIGITKQLELHFKYPNFQEQKEIVGELDGLLSKTKIFNQKYHQKLTNLEELKKSLLQKAFAGELT